MYGRGGIENHKRKDTSLIYGAKTTHYPHGKNKIGFRITAHSPHQVLKT